MAHEILAAQPADAPAILALQRLAYETEARLYGDWSIPPLTQTLQELEAEFGRMAVLKAVDGAGRIVGSVRAELDTAAAPPICRIGKLMVHPQARRQGLGTALLAAAEEAFPQAGRHALFTGSLSEDNLRLYARAGYVEVGRKAVKPGLTLVFLEKTGRAGA